MNITLPKRDTITDWVDLEDGKKLKVDYPKGKQVHILQDLSVAVTDLDGNYNYSNFLKYSRMFLKFTIKDWDGFSVPCKLHKNELDDDLWYDITEDIATTQYLYSKIEEVVRWNEYEKKS